MGGSVGGAVGFRVVGKPVGVGVSMKGGWVNGGGVKGGRVKGGSEKGD